MDFFDINSIKDINAKLPTFTNVNDIANSVDSSFSYNAYDISGLQLHNPIYNRIFNLTSYSQDISSISLKHDYHLYSNEEVLSRQSDIVTKRPIHIKYSPILDPLRYMVGKYEGDMNILGSLPKLSDENKGMSKNIYMINDISTFHPLKITTKIHTLFPYVLKRNLSQNQQNKLRKTSHC